MSSFRVTDTDIRYINLDERTDRRTHMEAELSKAGITAERFRGRRPEEWKGDMDSISKMIHRRHQFWPEGNLGCYLSHTTLMKQQADRRPGRHLLAIEDDCCLADDFTERLKYLEDHLTWDWDCIFLGATFHTKPAVWHRATLGRDAECTSDPHIMRAYGVWCSYCWIINAGSIAKLLELFDREKHRSYAIDHLQILVEPELQAYVMVPGAAWQMDDRSSILGVHQVFSRFKPMLGPYVWTSRMTDFDPRSYDWGECRV